MDWRPISADSHITEPPTCYVDHIDPAYRERAPRVMHREGIGDTFIVDGMKAPVPLGLVAAAGIAPKDLRMGGAKFEGQSFKWFSNSTELYTPIIGYRQINFTQQEPIYGVPTPVSGLRLVDARASYGLGLETFALGFPIHFDYSWKTLFNKDWEDLKFAAVGGSRAFRDPKFTVWIGYDF